MKRRQYLLAVLSGSLLALSMPRPGIWLLAWVGLAPMLVSLRRARARDAGCVWAGGGGGIFRDYPVLDFAVRIPAVGAGDPCRGRICGAVRGDCRAANAVTHRMAGLHGRSRRVGSHTVGKVARPLRIHLGQPGAHAGKQSLDGSDGLHHGTLGNRLPRLPGQSGCRRMAGIEQSQTSPSFDGGPRSGRAGGPRRVVAHRAETVRRENRGRHHPGQHRAGRRAGRITSRGHSRHIRK